MTDEDNAPAPTEDPVPAPVQEEPVAAEGGPVPGSSPIVIEDAPPLGAPLPVEDPAPEPVAQPVVREAPAPANVPVLSAKTLAEQEAGRKKVEERTARQSLVETARAADDEVGQENRVAQAQEANKDL